jgi:hypothetical protein
MSALTDTLRRGVAALAGQIGARREPRDALLCMP